MSASALPLPPNTPHALREFAPDAAGLYRCELTVTLPTGVVQAFPGQGDSADAARLRATFQASWAINMASFCADDDDDDVADDADADATWGVTGSPHAADGDSSGSEGGGMLGRVGGLGDADGSDGTGAVSCEFRDASQGGGDAAGGTNGGLGVAFRAAGDHAGDDKRPNDVVPDALPVIEMRPSGSARNEPARPVAVPAVAARHEAAPAVAARHEAVPAVAARHEVALDAAPVAARHEAARHEAVPDSVDLRHTPAEDIQPPAIDSKNARAGDPQAENVESESRQADHARDGDESSIRELFDEEMPLMQFKASLLTSLSGGRMTSAQSPSSLEGECTESQRSPAVMYELLDGAEAHGVAIQTSASQEEVRQGETVRKVGSSTEPGPSEAQSEHSGAFKFSEQQTQKLSGDVEKAQLSVLCKSPARKVSSDLHDPRGLEREPVTSDVGFSKKAAKGASGVTDDKALQQLSKSSAEGSERKHPNRRSELRRKSLTSRRTRPVSRRLDLPQESPSKEHRDLADKILGVLAIKTDEYHGTTLKPNPEARRRKHISRRAEKRRRSSEAQKLQSHSVKESATSASRHIDTKSRSETASDKKQPSSHTNLDPKISSTDNNKKARKSSPQPSRSNKIPEQTLADSFAPPTRRKAEEAPAAESPDKQTAEEMPSMAFALAKQQKDDTDDIGNAENGMASQCRANEGDPSQPHEPSQYFHNNFVPANEHSQGQGFGRGVMPSAGAASNMLYMNPMNPMSPMHPMNPMHALNSMGPMMPDPSSSGFMRMPPNPGHAMQMMNGMNGMNGMIGMNGINGMNGMNRMNGMNNMATMNGMATMPGMNSMNAMHGVNAMNGMNAMSAIHGMNAMNGVGRMNAMNGIHNVNGVTTMNRMNAMNAMNGMNGNFPFPGFHGMMNGIPGAPFAHQIPGGMSGTNMAGQLPPSDGMRQHATEHTGHRNERFASTRKGEAFRPGFSNKKVAKDIRSAPLPSTAQQGKKRPLPNDDSKGPVQSGRSCKNVHRRSSDPVEVRLSSSKEGMAPVDESLSDEESDGEDHISLLHVISQRGDTCGKPSFRTYRHSNNGLWKCTASVQLPPLDKGGAKVLTRTVVARNTKKAKRKASKEILSGLKELKGKGKDKTSSTAEDTVKGFNKTVNQTVDKTTDKISDKPTDRTAMKTADKIIITTPERKPSASRGSVSSGPTTPVTPQREKLRGIKNPVAALLQLMHWDVLLHDPAYDFEELSGGKGGHWRCTLILNLNGGEIVKVYHDAAQKRQAKYMAAQKGFERLKELKLPEMECFSNVKVKNPTPETAKVTMPPPVNPSAVKAIVQMSDDEESEKCELDEDNENFERRLLLPKLFKLSIPDTDEECEEWIREHVRPGAHVGVFFDSWSARVAFENGELMPRDSQRKRAPQFPMLCLSTKTAAIIVREGKFFAKTEECLNSVVSASFWVPRIIGDVLEDYRILKHGYALDQGLMTLREKHGVCVRAVNDVAVTSYAISGLGSAHGNRVLASLGQLVKHWLQKDALPVSGNGIWSTPADAPKEFSGRDGDVLALALLSSYASLCIRERTTHAAAVKLNQNMAHPGSGFDELCSRLLKFH